MMLVLQVTLVLAVLSQHAFPLTHGAVLGTSDVPTEGASPSFESEVSDSLIIENVDVNKLSEENLEDFLMALDEKFIGELDIEVGKHTLESVPSGRRTKRWIPLVARGAFAVGRGIFRALSRAKVSKSAGKITRQYNRRGDFKKAVSDFHRLKPTNVKRFNGRDGLTGLEGRVGKHTVKVRSSSSGKRPTIESYRTDKAARKIIRKVRYDKN
ncbi:uncharacterized protein LOC117338047 [Pecten maximus]|uniref:uncharacterized protein LOC117338047 n=1 Tax=Pecten maximus TaxID=6579 RepID=UPI00145876D4|nr:uncharacterized protein LOC117338047 [Pecten maximus]